MQTAIHLLSSSILNCIPENIEMECKAATKPQVHCNQKTSSPTKLTKLTWRSGRHKPFQSPNLSLNTNRHDSHCSIIPSACKVRVLYSLHVWLVNCCTIDQGAKGSHDLLDRPFTNKRAWSKSRSLRVCLIGHQRVGVGHLCWDRCLGCRLRGRLG